MKPRIIKAGLRWLCKGRAIIGSGESPSAAYTHWLRQSYELELRRVRAESIKQHSWAVTPPWERRFS